MKKHKGPIAADEKGGSSDEFTKLQRDVDMLKETQRNLEFRFDDMVELHQQEMWDLKQEFSLLEEKISYYIATKLQEFDDKVQDCHASISALERQVFLWTSFDQYEGAPITRKIANTTLAFLSLVMILAGTIINMANSIFALRRSFVLVAIILALALYLWYRQ